MRSSRKVFACLAVFLILHYVGIRLMARYGLMERILANDGSSLAALAGALFFLLVRFALLFAGPGLLLWGTWLAWRESKGESLQ